MRESRSFYRDKVIRLLLPFFFYAKQSLLHSNFKCTFPETSRYFPFYYHFFALNFLIRFAVSFFLCNFAAYKYKLNNYGKEKRWP